MIEGRTRGAGPVESSMFSIETWKLWADHDHPQLVPTIDFVLFRPILISILINRLNPHTYDSLRTPLLTGTPALLDGRTHHSQCSHSWSWSDEVLRRQMGTRRVRGRKPSTHLATLQSAVGISTATSIHSVHGAVQSLACDPQRGPSSLLTPRRQFQSLPKLHH